MKMKPVGTLEGVRDLANGYGSDIGVAHRDLGDVRRPVAAQIFDIDVDDLGLRLLYYIPHLLQQKLPRSIQQLEHGSTVEYWEMGMGRKKDTERVVYRKMIYINLWWHVGKGITLLILTSWFRTPSRFLFSYFSCARKENKKMKYWFVDFGFFFRFCFVLFCFFFFIF